MIVLGIHPGKSAAIAICHSGNIVETRNATIDGAIDAIKMIRPDRVAVEASFPARNGMQLEKIYRACAGLSIDIRNYAIREQGIVVKAGGMSGHAGRHKAKNSKQRIAAEIAVRAGKWLC